MTDFDLWNQQKQQLDAKNDFPYFKVREVWWCSLGKNIGFEESGKNDNFERPVLILRKFNRELFVGVPLTTVAKHNKFHYQLPKNSDTRQGFAILSQVRIISARRLNRRIYQVGEKTTMEIRQKYHELLVEKPDINRSPERTRGSRTANAGLYDNCTKPKAKSQVRNMQGSKK